ncbi:MAG TPA: LLM class flavin-dependent oxidoreductase [Roseiflexaceae bacterium]|nr:LLM class flavin-dependent oxidoreductase [Roseiflexaceae bacterium]
MAHEEHNAQTGAARFRRERVGIALGAADPPALVAAIEAAEAAGVAQVWMTQNPVSPDALTVYAAALGRTARIRLGTSIVPTYPRHPLALAQQAATVAALGPGRLRLGVGPSHRPTIEGVYGLPMGAPLAHLREYVAVLRGALWEGKVEHQGRFFTAKVTLQRAPQVPLLVSALGAGAFRLAGELADGAISWNCPPRYLLDVALPALREGAHTTGRPAPPLVAHMWVGLSTDAEAVRAAGRKALAGYARLPFYARMFAAAGYPVQPDGSVSDALIDAIVAAGDDATVAARLDELLGAGLDELLLTALPLGDPAAERQRLIAFAGRL